MCNTQTEIPLYAQCTVSARNLQPTIAEPLLYNPWDSHSHRAAISCLNSVCSIILETLKKNEFRLCTVPIFIPISSTFSIHCVTASKAVAHTPYMTARARNIQSNNNKFFVFGTHFLMQRIGFMLSSCNAY